MHFDEYDGGVQLRHGHGTATLSSVDAKRKCESTGSTLASIKTEQESDKENNDTCLRVLNVSLDGSDKSRHSDTQVLMEYSGNNSQADGDNQRITMPTSSNRKFHSKSFSLSENRIAAVAAGSNLFQQNRELWEKRAELQSQQCLTTPRILTRNRIAPDLVMDLPFANKDGVVHSSRESLNSGSDEIIGNDNRDTNNINNALESTSRPIEDMTSAERFAAQNQCTLKKNERFSGGSSCIDSTGIELRKENKVDFKSNSSADKPKAEVKPQENNSLMKELSTDLEFASKIERSNCSKLTTDSLLHIDEMACITIASTAATTATATIGKELTVRQPITKDVQHKSPIPARNTQKFVSKFADLHLTGGCLSTGTSTASTTTSSSVDSLTQSQQPQTLSSFKPQVKVKPHILRKPLVLPPTTPEMVRRNQD